MKNLRMKKGGRMPVNYQGTPVCLSTALYRGRCCTDVYGRVISGIDDAGTERLPVLVAKHIGVGNGHVYEF